MMGPMLDALVGGLAQIILIAALVSRPARARELAAAWLPILLGVVRRAGITRDAEAREAVHDALAGAWTGVVTGRYTVNPRADRAAALLAYIKGAAWRIADRRVRERITWRRRYVSLEDDDAPELPGRDPTGHIEARSDLERIYRRISARDESLLVGRAIGLTHDENGAEIGVGEGAARHYLPRILAEAAQALAPPEEAPAGTGAAERAAAARARRAGLAEGLRRAVERLCNVLRVDLTADRRAELRRLDVAALDALADHLERVHRWPDPRL